MMFLPSGSQDDLGSIVSNRHHVFESFRSITTLRGYQEISTPVIEYSNTFTNKRVGMPLQNMLKWFNADGEIEVLRPDWTTAIARSLTKQSRKQQKWAYQGSVFQRNKPGIENRQVGIEIINHPFFLGESECLLMAKNFLEVLNIRHYLIELGHTGIFEELTKQLALSDEEMESLRIAMHDKRKDEVYKIISNKGHLEIADELSSIIDAFGTFKTIDEFEKRWGNNPVLLKILNHLKKLAVMLKKIGVEEVIVDLGRVKNLPYYSGTMFRGFLTENGATCFSGGRYDPLYEQDGMDNNAVGLAFDVDVLAEKIQQGVKKNKVCIIATDETIFYAEELRHQYKDFIVDVQYEMVNENNYDKVLYLSCIDGKYEVIEK